MNLRAFLGTLCCGSLVLVSGFVGCGPSIPGDTRQMAPVSGTLLQKSAPYTAGGISLVFSPTNGDSPVTVVVGADGKFQGQAVIGQNKVRLMKIAGGAASAHSEPTTTGFSADYFTEKTELSANVTEKGPNEFSLEAGTSGGSGGVGSSTPKPSGAHAK